MIKRFDFKKIKTILQNQLLMDIENIFDNIDEDYPAIYMKRGRDLNDIEDEKDDYPAIYMKKQCTENIEKEIDWTEWVSASSTRNFLIKDPLLDWLSYYSSSVIIKSPKYATEIVKSVNIRKKDNFTEFIMSQGCEFEEQVMRYLYNLYEKDTIYNVGGNLNARSEQKYKETIDLMNQGIPIIYQGVLHNKEDQTYGVPDIIIRSDWIEKIVKKCPISKKDWIISAPLLKNCVDDKLGSDHRKSPPYHYRIIDIKFTTLKLKSDGIHLLNYGSIPAYKGQLYIYNKALEKIQGYFPGEAYILGRKWKYQTRNEIYTGSTCVEKLGVVDFIKKDIIYVEKTKEAIKWIREMRRDGSSWSIGPNLPLCRKELYPNMSNPYDYPWKSVKMQIASEIKEITSLWMCGVKNRNIAFEKDIYQWSDPRCTTDTLGINGEKTKRVLEKILEINKTEGELIYPKIILNNDEEWQSSHNLEFYVDFEFINDVVSEFTNIPDAETRSMIFMIGVGYVEPNTKKWKYKEFTCNSLTEAEEYIICSNFSQYVRDESEFYETLNPLLVHWSNAENWQWDSVVKKHRDKNQKNWIQSKKEFTNEGFQAKWFDLLQVFRKEPIVIKGCLGFGLKEVVKNLSKLGYIKNLWDGDSSCVDGAGAMLSAYKSYQDAKNKNVKVKTIPLMKDLIKYNEMDCIVLSDILQYLRNNHINKNDVI